MILHSPLMSGMRVAFPQTKRTWFFDAFPRYSYEVFLVSEGITNSLKLKNDFFKTGFAFGSTEREPLEGIESGYFSIFYDVYLTSVYL